MTLTLELKPETEATLRAAAQRRGVELPTLLDELAAEMEAEALLDEQDAQEARERLANPDPRPYRTLADLRAHIDAQRQGA